MSTFLSIAVAIAAATGTGAQDRALLCFQTEAGPLQARTLDLESGVWRHVWTHTPRQREARAISVASLGDRVGALWSLGERKLYAEVGAADGRSKGVERSVTSDAETILVASGRPLVLDSGGYPHYVALHRERHAPGAGSEQAHGRQTVAVSAQDGEFVVTAYSEAHAGSSYSLLNAFQVRPTVRKLMEPMMTGPAAVSDIATYDSVVAVARGVFDVEIYRIGPRGLQLLDTITVPGYVQALMPLRAGGGFYGVTEIGIVTLRHTLSRWSYNQTLALNLHGVNSARFIQTTNHVGLIAGDTVYRLRRGPSGSLTLLGRSDLPPGLIR